MKNKIILLGFLLLIITAVSLLEYKKDAPTTSTTLTSEWATHRNNDMGIEFQYPAYLQVFTEGKNISLRDCEQCMGLVHISSKKTEYKEIDLVLQSKEMSNKKMVGRVAIDGSEGIIMTTASEDEYGNEKIVYVIKNEDLFRISNRGVNDKTLWESIRFF